MNEFLSLSFVECGSVQCFHPSNEKGLRSNSFTLVPGYGCRRGPGFRQKSKILEHLTVLEKEEALLDLYMLIYKKIIEITGRETVADLFPWEGIDLSQTYKEQYRSMLEKAENTLTSIPIQCPNS